MSYRLHRQMFGGVTHTGKKLFPCVSAGCVVINHRVSVCVCVCPITMSGNKSSVCSRKWYVYRRSNLNALNYFCCLCKLLVQLQMFLFDSSVSLTCDRLLSDILWTRCHHLPSPLSIASFASPIQMTRRFSLGLCVRQLPPCSLDTIPQYLESN